MPSSRTTVHDVTMSSSKPAALDMNLSSTSFDNLLPEHFYTTPTTPGEEERRVTYRSLYRSSTSETPRLSLISSSGISVGPSSRSSSYTNEEMMRANHKIVYDSPDELKMQAIEKTRDFWVQHRYNNFKACAAHASHVQGPASGGTQILLTNSLTMHTTGGTHYRNFSMIKAK